MQEQLELALDDWRVIKDVEDGWKTPREIEMLLKGGKVVEGHFACDMSGECQAPFKGWFVPVLDERGRVSFFSEVTPTHWRPKQPVHHPQG